MTKTRECLEKALANFRNYRTDGTGGHTSQAISVLNYLLDGVNGKRILDIGCGGTSDEIYYPDLCRKLLNYGAIPVGIDIGVSPKNEKFECYNAEAEKMLPELNKDDFDAIVTSQFFNDFMFGGKYDNILKNMPSIMKNNGFYLNVTYASDQINGEKERFIDACKNNMLNLLIDCPFFGNNFLVFKKGAE